MKYPIEFRPAARQEFDEAADWYETQVPGLRVTFVHAVDEVLLRISTSPLAFPLVHGSQVRCAIIKKFPYVVLFEFEGEVRILVHAIFHTSRNPRNWQARLRSK